ncbi:hypothetical protein GNI_133620 [Gregarina niphandrodes]|uniref:Uncharacterized protein n=1 Tax=Gregarina niphandrodes TaxID=110365 RepID=A0A023B197_GRENI|nr:hypothetical protein GNI_133620 [Gregarina niphandrodes]EZG46521.1 hypothetical protein GNI_133620 [Gregarina niphandrodes]|eukprot:XP_011132294.1 hypothetical protein GNI_133620 [Gregarina niphandrodes]
MRLESPTRNITTLVQASYGEIDIEDNSQFYPFSNNPLVQLVDEWGPNDNYFEELFGWAPSDDTQIDIEKFGQEQLHGPKDQHGRTTETPEIDIENLLAFTLDDSGADDSAAELTHEDFEKLLDDILDEGNGKVDSEVWSGSDLGDLLEALDKDGAGSSEFSRSKSDKLLEPLAGEKDSSGAADIDDSFLRGLEELPPSGLLGQIEPTQGRRYEIGEVRKSDQFGESVLKGQATAASSTSLRDYWSGVRFEDVVSESVVAANTPSGVDGERAAVGRSLVAAVRRIPFRIVRKRARRPERVMTEVVKSRNMRTGSDERNMMADERPGFEIQARGEEFLCMSARYLMWAYDVKKYGWSHFAGFDTSNLSVFGLAKKVRDLVRRRESCLMTELTLGSSCYDISPGRRMESVAWDKKRFLTWLDHIDHDNSIGSRCNRLTNRFIPAEKVDEAIADALQYWPAVGTFARRIHCWWCARTKYYNDPECQPLGKARVSRWDFEQLVIKKLGDLGAPLEEVAKSCRRELRRKLILKTQEHLQQEHLQQEHLQQEHLQQEHLQQEHLQQEHLQQEHLQQEHLQQGQQEQHIQVKETNLQDTVPSELVGACGNKFQIATVEETQLQIEPKYLVWSYDIHNNNWWGSVPHAMRGLSVFGLARCAREWILAGNELHTLNVGCYTCCEGGMTHLEADGCERCESPWNIEEFWEWLRCRHFCADDEDGEKTTDVPRLGFDAPDVTRLQGVVDQSRFAASVWTQPINFFVPRESDCASLPCKVRQWWDERPLDAIAAKGLSPWECERIFLYKLNRLAASALDDARIVVETRDNVFEIVEMKMWREAPIL